MSLNIKNPHTHALAAGLARRLNVSMTEAVTLALEEKLARTDRGGAEHEARVRRILEIGRACAERLSPEIKALDHGEMLYDARGLPK